MAVTVLIRLSCDSPSSSAPPSSSASPSSDAPSSKDGLETAQLGATLISLTLDAPRIVIGRSKGCDIQLPDPSVSPRHASIRQQGGRNLVMDEGSTNGVMVMSPDERAGVRLPPQTPRALSDGDLIRVGRIWLEVTFCAAVPSTSADVKAAAHAVMMNALREQGEPVNARLLQDGEPMLTLDDTSREHVLGRAMDASLVLTDELASRRHAMVVHEGGRWCVKDLGSKRGTQIGDEAVSPKGTALTDGCKLHIGGSTFTFSDPLQNALSDIRKADDIELPASQLPRTPPGLSLPDPVVVDAPPEGGDESLLDDVLEAFELDEDEEFRAVNRHADEPRGAGFAAVDALLVLVALSVLGASALGLAYVLG